MWMMDLANPYIVVVIWMTLFGGLPFDFQSVGCSPYFIDYNYLIQHVVPFLIKSFETDTACNTYSVALHLNNVAPMWQESCIFLSPVIKFGALGNEKSLYAQVIASQYSACLIHAMFTCGH
jgi:hypothetical protein